MFRTRSAPRPRRRRAPDPLEPPPTRESVFRPETRPGQRHVPPSFLGRHRDRADHLPLQSQALQELPHLSRSTFHAGEVFDPLASFGDRPRRLLLQRLTDDVSIPSQFARRLVRSSRSSQSVQAATTVETDVALHARHRKRFMPTRNMPCTTSNSSLPHKAIL